VFDVHTMKPDGTGVASMKAPRLAERWLAWSPDGTSVHYLGAVTAPAAAGATPAPVTGELPHGKPKTAEGATSLWRLDLESGSERRLSPEDLHVIDFSSSPDGQTVVAGLLPSSTGPEIFRLDAATGAAARLTTSRPSEWMPVPSPDATRVAYATNEGALDALRVADLEGEEIAAYPGFALEDDAKFFWLPKAGGLLVFSGRGMHAFSEKGPIAIPTAKDHRALLHADVSLQDDKVALSAIPRYGETPGLYVLEAVDDAFVQRDLRYVSAAEDDSTRYLQPRWSTDGRRIAFTDGTDVWTMNADGTERRRLTAYADASKERKGGPSAASFPVWAVRGGRVAYTLTVYSGASVLRELWVVDADGKSPRRVFSEEVDSQFQVFLPEYTSAPFFDASDAHLIATVLHRGLPNVVSIDLASGKTTALTETGAISPAMLPEEDSIVYTSLQGNDERIWIMNANGTAKRPLLSRDRTKQGGTGGGQAPAR
jgi:Tol biopolymer transport system component